MRVARNVVTLGRVTGACLLGVLVTSACHDAAVEPTPTEHGSAQQALDRGHEVLEWRRFQAPPARQVAHMTYDEARRRVVLFGGARGNTVFRDVWESDGRGWSNRTPALGGPSGRAQGAVAYDSNRQRALVFGGVLVAGIASDLWEWDGRTWTERTWTGPGPTQLGATTISYDSDRKRMVLFGGARLKDGVWLDETWEWDGQSWERKQPAQSPSPRMSVALGYDHVRHRTLLFGGSDAQGGRGDTWEWDGQTWTERTPAHKPEPSFWSQLVHDGQRLSLLAYGNDGANVEVWSWDGQDWSRVSTTSTAPALAYFAATYDRANQRAVLFGGVNGSETTGAAWRWDGQNWADVTSTPDPPARNAPSMAYDTARERVVLFGGLTGQLDGNLWEWDGARWSHREPGSADRPEARARHAMAYDAARQRVLVFGGSAATALKNDLWEWDGQTWTERTGSGAWPPARQAARMVYDVARQRIVLFGGSSPSGELQNDQWEWDGQTWTERTLTGTFPAARYFHAMVYDAARQRIVLFGGATEANVDTMTNEIWEWDGQRWENRTPASGSPTPRVGYALSYDAARARVVLVASPAANTYGVDVELWEWDGVAWHRPPSSAGPTPEHSFDAVYDDAHHEILVYGGQRSNSLLDETWLLSARGAPCSGNQDATTGACVDGVACESSACPGSCVACNTAEQPGRCAPVLLADDPDSCSVGANGSSCDRFGACKAALGQPVQSAEECVSGFLVDGVCCETAACGPCQTCNATEKEIADNAGRCGTQRAGSDKKDDCAAADPASCKQDGSCDGRGQCRLYAAGTSCGPAAHEESGVSGQVCSGAGECQRVAASCDGDHTVVAPNGERTDCAGYRCEGASCKSSCSSVADCSAGFVCDSAKQCVADRATPPSSDDGCSCRNAPGHAVTPWPWLASLGLLAWRRQARRSSRVAS